MNSRGFRKRRAQRYVRQDAWAKATQRHTVGFRGFARTRRKQRWGNWGVFQPGSRWQPRNAIAPRTRAAPRFTYGSNPPRSGIAANATRRARKRRDRLGRFR